MHIAARPGIEPCRLRSGQRRDDPVCTDGQDDPNLLAATEPRVRTRGGTPAFPRQEKALSVAAASRPRCRRLQTY